MIINNVSSKFFFPDRRDEKNQNEQLPGSNVFKSR